MKMYATKADGSRLANTDVLLYVYTRQESYPRRTDTRDSKPDFIPVNITTDDKGNFELADEHKGKHISPFINHQRQPPVTAEDGAEVRSWGNMVPTPRRNGNKTWQDVAAAEPIDNDIQRSV